MRKIFLTVAAAGAVLLTTACNTIEGAGRDIQSVGDTIEDAAD
jgi:predicted small secreted protein